MEDQVRISADTDGAENAAEDTERWLKKRFILAIMGFLGFANVYAMRVNLSVAIVAMVNTTTDGAGDKLSLVSWNSSLLDPLPMAARKDSSDSCQDLNESYNDSSYYAGEFDWSEKTQGIVLGSFFYGYVTTQIPGGRMAEGVTFPSMMAIMAKWVPPLERSRFSGVVFAETGIRSLEPSGTFSNVPLSCRDGDMFQQVYFIGEEQMEVDQPCANINGLRWEIIEDLQRILHKYNQLIHVFERALDQMVSNEHKVVIRADKRPVGEHEH
ncbi:hypothetical protein J437_LFUL017792 [Ladona fulva]|uniref:Uncharacterized protein n=1 Tax=Ladona fulva TaxID=123851 RepID=A0A8K0KTJ1_LADFU|nr:hypothetical protein J437_LFUL017792 [Ladona fulva]